MADEIKELTDAVKAWRDNQEIQLAVLRKLLMGNGEVGLCEKVRDITGQIKPLWTLVSILGVAILGGLVKLIFFV